ncbi:hypothetical protein F2Q69_00000879 [Brassica cretica]|uniref:Uncharacterized protein n=1 Tax=Brassica cretica TaxID=69181 RepID=A0A8S9P7R9_BRACR|nr:hypothetical protein F2Q69_00000879 [Brassica cretica]
MEATTTELNFLSPDFGLDGDSRDSLLDGANVENGFVFNTLLLKENDVETLFYYNGNN